MSALIPPTEWARIRRHDSYNRAVDESLCFVERETALLNAPRSGTQADTFVSALEQILDTVSTPVMDFDLLLGRPIYGPLPTDAYDPFDILHPAGRLEGHMTPDYHLLITKGLSGIVALSQSAAQGSPDGEFPYRREFAARAGRAVEAVRRFAVRYAGAARLRAEKARGLRRADWLRAAAALETVPFDPAPDFFSALQAVWFMHLIFSCYMGGRDFGFGRMDVYLAPLYDKGLQEGAFTRQDAVRWLSDFILHTNELGGFNSITGEARPIPCNSTKQYIVLGGCDEQGLPYRHALGDLLVGLAGELRQLQPTLTVRVGAAMETEWKRSVYHAAQMLCGQVHLFNDGVIIPALTRLGVKEPAARDHTFSACNRTDFTGSFSQEAYHNMVSWLVESLHYDRPELLDGDGDIEAVIQRFSAIAAREIEKHKLTPFEDQGPQFHLESLLIKGCGERALDIHVNGQALRSKCHYFSGLATVADSLSAIQHMVFESRALTLRQFVRIAADNYKSDPSLPHAVRSRCPRYGNDDPRADRFAARISDCVFDVLDDVNGKRREADLVDFGGFYSLFNHHTAEWRNLPATPDGRLTGEAISENQSPVYGADVGGITPLLKSVTAARLSRSAVGGLNVLLSGPLPDDILLPLLDTYFALGGVHIGLSAVDHATLEEARRHPGQFPNLYVRITGYSELFSRLPDHMQKEIISRTPH